MLKNSQVVGQAEVGAMNALPPVGWTVVIHPAWLRTPAEACAERLLGAAERV